MRKHRQPTSAIGKKQTGTIHCVSANIQLPAYIRGLWVVAREIQTNDMSIRIRFHFLAPRKSFCFSFAPRKFFCFGFWGGCAEAERITNDSLEGPKSFCQGKSLSSGIFLDHLLHKCHREIVQWLNYRLKNWFNVKLLWAVSRGWCTNVTNSWEFNLMKINTWQRVARVQATIGWFGWTHSPII